MKLIFLFKIMKLAYDTYKAFLVINPNLCEEKFLEIVGAKRGYSVQMFSRIHRSIYSELIDIENEYNKYYICEYNNFENFLYKKYNIPSEDIKKLLKKIKKYPHCKIFKKDDHSYGDYSIPQFIESETMYKRIFKILKLDV